MKLFMQQRISETCRIGMALIAGGLLAGQLMPRASAQEEKAVAPAAGVSPTASSETASPPEPQSKIPETREPSSATYSAGIQEMLKLADAKVSSDVLKSFVEHSANAGQPSAAEIIALKERGVADEVITALMNRSAEVKAQAGPSRARVAVPTIVKDFSTGGQLDPESYDFWYYHYAYPRALSYSYRTLSPYYPPRSGGFSGPSRHGSRSDNHHFRRDDAR